jgi:hypothetical protein
MRSRNAAAVLHGFRTLVVLGLVVGLSALTTGVAAAAADTTGDPTVVQGGISANLPGEVGMIAILLGVAGVAVGVIRQRRRRRAAARSAA